MNTCGACGFGNTRVLVEGIRDWEYGVHGEWSYVECPSCLAIRLHPFPGIEDLRRAYDIPYHGHVDRGGRGLLTTWLMTLDAWVMERSLRPLLPQGARILDVGCGAGTFLERVGRLGSFTLEGLDFSPKAVSMARSRGFTIHEGLFLSAPLQESAYDVVTMNNYLEHTLDPKAELARAHSMLKPSGLLLGEVPGFDAPERKVLGRYWGGNHVPRHTHQFTGSSLEKILRDGGWNHIRIWRSPNPVHLALGIQNILVRRTPGLGLQSGRAPYFPLLLLAALPFHLFQMLVGRSGVLKFSATS
ncbi:MAG: class I SAM-dependent methyltransferase [Planctomycetota bacterium]